MAKRIALLGSTGSIGVQALQVIEEQGYTVTALAAGSRVNLLAQQALRYRPAILALANAAGEGKLRAALAGSNYQPVILTGPDAALELTKTVEADILLNAIVGIAGLNSTLEALERGLDVALANKESLVTGGALVMKTAAKTGAKLLPVDSEHSAIFQCLQDTYAEKGLTKLLLTASGGPFYGKTTPELKTVTAKDALKHPNWDMGAKITIDSASLMNKGLEFIEAMWLFDVKPADIQVVVQRESIIHSMIELADGSVLAQLGVPDMRIPIQYALTWPQRLPGCAPRLDFTTLTGLSFGTADEATFRCLAACKQAAEKGGLAPCAANGANEEAVALFLQDKIGFLDIGRLVEGVVNSESFWGGYTLADVHACDTYARRYVYEHI